MMARCSGLSAVVEPVLPRRAANGLVATAGAEEGGGGTFCAWGAGCAGRGAVDLVTAEFAFGRAAGVGTWFGVWLATCAKAGTANAATSAPIKAVRPSPNIKISACAPRFIF